MVDAAAGTPEIRLTDLSKHFRDVRAVDRVSLEIRSGGFELPTSGRIELRGRDVTSDPPDKRPVNMVFQNYALFPHLDVAENIAFGLRRKAVDRAQIKQRVGEALDL